MSADRVLVTCAAGFTGGAAVDTALKLGLPVRAFVHVDDARAAALRARGVEVAIGDLSNIDSVRAALEGVRAAYFVYPIGPVIIDATAYFAQAAKEAGVGAIVNMSQISARRDFEESCGAGPLGLGAGLRLVRRPDDALASDVLRRVADLSPVCRNDLEGEAHRDPVRDGRHAPIAAEDQGRVIGHILADPAPHAGQTYKLFGPIEMDYYGIAAAVSETLGVEIAYTPISIDEFRRDLSEKQHYPPFLVQHLAEVAQDCRNGLFAGTNDVIERVTGKPPMTVQAFISRHRQMFA